MNKFVKGRLNKVFLAEIIGSRFTKWLDPELVDMSNQTKIVFKEGFAELAKRAGVGKIGRVSKG